MEDKASMQKYLNKRVDIIYKIKNFPNKFKFTGFITLITNNLFIIENEKEERELLVYYKNLVSISLVKNKTVYLNKVTFPVKELSPREIQQDLWHKRFGIMLWKNSKPYSKPLNKVIKDIWEKKINLSDVSSGDQEYVKKRYLEVFG